MARIYDNIDVKFTDGLRGIVTNTGVKHVDFCVGYFNLRGWGLISEQVERLTGEFIYENDDRVFRICRLLVGMYRPPEDLIRVFYYQQGNIVDTEEVKRCKRVMAADFRRQLTIGIPTANDEKTLRQLNAQLKANRVAVKLYLREALHAKLYLAHRPDDHFNKIQAIMGSSNLTYGGLTGQGELNAEFGDSDSAEKLAMWFDNRWNDRFCIDITNELIEIIDDSWATEKTIPPYYIYLKTAYHLSAEARTGMNEYELPPVFKRELFDFQTNAFNLAARYLDKRGGAMIGDVVGLGKTITACAIAKVYEMRNACSTLILCPANLQEMWRKYVVKYDLKADIISIAKRLDPKNMRYYRLVIVDESHNLRNSEGKRYHNIKELIDYQDCKVLLLTATPYNMDYSYLSNQLKLFVADDEDLGIQPEAYIRQLGGAREFSKRHAEDFIRSIKAFSRSPEADDWRELMRLFFVRRTRTFIKDNYAKKDLHNGRKYLLFPDGKKSYFPDRLPKAIKFPTVQGDQFSRLYSQGMTDLMDKLLLPRYGLSMYIDNKVREQVSETENLLLDNLSRAGVRMMGFCRTNFFKRLDSSGFSFLISLYRHILRNSIFLYAIDNNQPLPIGDEGELPDDYHEDEDREAILLDNNEMLLAFPAELEMYNEKAELYYQSITGNTKTIKWIDSRFFTSTLRDHLQNDCLTLIEMIKLCGAWAPQTDQKLNALQSLLTETHCNEKIIVFTQFADTAEYVTEQLIQRGLEKVMCVTGDSENPTRIAEYFSPVSNEQTVAESDQYRVLIATDVLSEGQNLQDAHIVVNYDLPWAIIRLIQRAGRVDRIGQKAEQIYCYSFFPAEGIENIINLRRRLTARINENANIVGSDEIFFEGNEQNLRDMYNEKSGSLDDEEDGEVDLTSQAYQIWKSATEANPALKDIIPNLSNVIYATKKNPAESNKEGVITYAKTFTGNDMLMWMNKKGEIITQSQQTILQSMACSIDEPALLPLENHHEITGKSVAMMQTQEIRTSGILGSRFSTKFRLYTLLDGYCKSRKGSLFVTRDLELAVDEIYNFPLRESAKYVLGQQLKRVTPVEDIAELVVEMRKNDALCVVSEEDTLCRESVIICSMGLIQPLVQ